MGAAVAWAANLAYLVGALVRAPFWAFWALRGQTEDNRRPRDFASVMSILAFHVKGIVWPQWQPMRPRESAEQSE